MLSQISSRVPRLQRFQKWHGAAYIKLDTPADKKAYREEYDLNDRTLRDWATTVDNWFSGKTAAGGRLPFTYYSEANALANLDKPKAIELLNHGQFLGHIGSAVIFISCLGF